MIQGNFEHSHIFELHKSPLREVRMIPVIVPNIYRKRSSGTESPMGDTSEAMIKCNAKQATETSWKSDLWSETQRYTPET